MHGVTERIVINVTHDLPLELFHMSKSLNAKRQRPLTSVSSSLTKAFTWCCDRANERYRQGGGVTILTVQTGNEQDCNKPGCDSDFDSRPPRASTRLYPIVLLRLSPASQEGI